jgi:hypothetical protein
MLARVAESADAEGLNPSVPQGTCEFKSHPGHFNNEGSGRRRELIDALNRLDIEAYVLVSTLGRGDAGGGAGALHSHARPEPAGAWGRAELLIESRAEFDVIAGFAV